MQMTTQQIADALGIDKAEAYNLVSFMEKRGWIRPCGTHKVAGAKGKGSTIYELDQSLVTNMSNLLSRLFAS